MTPELKASDIIFHEKIQSARYEEAVNKINKNNETSIQAAMDRISNIPFIGLLV